MVRGMRMWFGEIGEFGFVLEGFRLARFGLLRGIRLCGLHLFLVHVHYAGFPVEEIVAIFSSFPDFEVLGDFEPIGEFRHVGAF